jgi:circadian clock protein KaiB
MLKLHIYVAGRTPDSAEAVNNLRRFLEEDFKDGYSLDIIDVLKAPELAKRDKVFATPTVIKSTPEPNRRIIGDLSDKEKLFLGLGLNQSPMR